MYGSRFDINALRLRRVMGGRAWQVPQPWGEDSWTMRSADGDGTVIASVSIEEGEPWVHASMSRTLRVPTYDDLKLLHRAVFNGWAYMPFAPPAEHINEHEWCLHLFGRHDGERVLPDFTRGSGHI